MALIKGQHANSAAQDAVVLDLSDIGQQAEKLKQDAQAKADRIVADAEQRAAQLVEGADERGYEQGHARGHEAGHAEGYEAGRAEALKQAGEQLQQLQQAWTEALQQWEQDSRWLQQQARDGVVDLALRLAEKVVHREVQVDRTAIVDQLAHGLAQVTRPIEVTAKIHPDDHPAVEEALPELVQQFQNVRQVELTTDATITPGGCWLTYGQGGIDLTLDKQLDRLVAAVRPQQPLAPASEDTPTNAPADPTPNDDPHQEPPADASRDVSDDLS
jgi:flagellar biosynthesis/type III secretory pathway protein FliH